MLKKRNNLLSFTSFVLKYTALDACSLLTLHFSNMKFFKKCLLFNFQTMTNLFEIFKIYIFNEKIISVIVIFVNYLNFFIFSFLPLRENLELSSWNFCATNFIKCSDMTKILFLYLFSANYRKKNQSNIWFVIKIWHFQRHVLLMSWE